MTVPIRYTTVTTDDLRSQEQVAADDRTREEVERTGATDPRGPGRTWTDHHSS
jgi:hypothetical protein